MLSKEDCIKRFKNRGVEWDYDLERDWCYTVCNWDDDWKQAWINQNVFNRQNKNRYYADQDEEEILWDDGYDYI